jgi:16S rRNA A1518/A1519 N6-dimethyltransferase RsmA/KsgA/DIM1 with predicted DNA glycosylase/AP lyase activity
VVIEELKNASALAPSNEVCEIGPGVGIYADDVLSAVRPVNYHIYETNLLSATYLEERYAPGSLITLQIQSSVWSMV